MQAAIIAGGFYALMSVVIGVDNHMANQDLAPGVPRPNAVLRGLFWLPYVIVGVGVCVFELTRPGEGGTRGW